jgi:hypothetical protein
MFVARSAPCWRIPFEQLEHRYFSMSSMSPLCPFSGRLESMSPMSPFVLFAVDRVKLEPTSFLAGLAGSWRVPVLTLMAGWRVHDGFPPDSPMADFALLDFVVFRSCSNNGRIASACVSASVRARAKAPSFEACSAPARWMCGQAS